MASSLLQLAFPEGRRVVARVLTGPLFEEVWVPCAVLDWEVDSQGGWWVKVTSDAYEDGTFWARASDLMLDDGDHSETPSESATVPTSV